MILDVVYNHFGPDGNFLSRFSPAYLTAAPDGVGRGPQLRRAGPAALRELVRENVAHWIDEYHLDGLRLDATQAISDGSPRHILAGDRHRRARAAAGRRHVVVIGENEPAARPSAAAARARAAWAWTRCGTTTSTTARVVALTGHRDAYYSDYEGTARELLAAVKHGFLFQGQRYRLAGQAPRGSARAGCRRGPSWPSSRTTTRWRTTGWGSGWARAPRPAPTGP